MKRLQKLLLTLGLFSIFMISTNCFAYDYYTHIVSTGCQIGGNCNITPQDNPQNCTYGTMYLDTSPQGKAIYAAALVAQMAGKTVRIVYTQNGGFCTVAIFSVNN